MTNPVNERLGRRRGNYTEKAHKKKVLQVVNKLAKECGGFRSDLAKSVLALEQGEVDS